MQIRPRLVTAARSPAGSAAVASVILRLKSLFSSPCTISQSSTFVVKGKEQPQFCIAKMRQGTVSGGGRSND